MFKRHAPLVFVLLSASAAWAQSPLPHVAKFTISKETTLIEKPLRPDGTVDYRSAVNGLLGKGITRENNAGPLLLSLTHRIKMSGFDETYKVLGLPPPGEDGPALEDFYTYTSRRSPERLKTTEQQNNFSDLYARLQHEPWTAAGQKDAAAWLADQAAALAVLDQAAAQPRFFLPFVAHGDSHILIEEIPFAPQPLSFAHVLTVHAMLRAGEGKLSEAIADIDRLRRLMRLMDQEHVSLDHLGVLAGESYGLLAAGSLAASGLSRQELGALRQEIEKLPELSLDDDTRWQVEEMLALDVVMSMIRGEGQTFLRLEAVEFDDSVKIDEGDLAKVDWDEALKTMVQKFQKDRREPSKPYAEEMGDIEARAKTGVKEGYPESILSLASGQITSIRKGVEDFLVMRKGETPADFSARLGRWLSTGNPADAKRSLKLEYRPRVARTLALVAVALGEYRVDHGTYPDTLNALKGVEMADTFSGKPLGYRCDGGSFVLWSVGIDEKGDGSAKQSDLIVRSHQLSH